MLYKIIKNHSYKLVIYALIIFLLLILFLGNHNLIEGNTCNDSEESLANSTLLDIINCNYETISDTVFTDISSTSICSNNLEDTINNVNNAGGLGSQAGDLYNSTGQLLSNAANADGRC
jgi:hypothetical protein